MTMHSVPAIRTDRIRLAAVAACLAWIAPTAAANDDAALPARLAWQIALDHVGFSPGIIDGKVGPKTELATREFQRIRGLTVTGRLDDATSLALRVNPDGATARYVVSADDLASVGPVPKNWLDKSKLARLAYESVAAAVAERFHCSRRLLERLNPGQSLEALAIGDPLIVPNVSDVAPLGPISELEIDLRNKVIRGMNARRQLVALFHCSIAAEKSNRPSGEATILSVTNDPTYLFDPRMWPEVKGIDRKLEIPPGPRNPVGVCWIGLSLSGYGIHGTPNPELIGKTGSHGCFRMTNWDARRLGAAARPGTKVRFLDGTTPVTKSSISSEHAETR